MKKNKVRRSQEIIAGFLAKFDIEYAKGVIETAFPGYHLSKNPVRKKGEKGNE
jgi:hypothetical protein